MPGLRLIPAQDRPAAPWYAPTPRPPAGRLGRNVGALMSSIESGRSDKQSSNRPAHQQKADSVRLEHESDDASRAPDDNYWDAPIHSRLAAAFHIGRLLNQLNWHLQYALFFSSPFDEKMVDEVLGRLEASSYSLVDRPLNHLADFIASYRDIFKEWLLCEAAHDEVVACYDDQLRRESETSEECRRNLVANRVRRPLDQLRKGICKVLLELEPWALNLGQHLDEGLRRSDVHRYFECEISLREDTSASGEHLGERYLKIQKSPRSFIPGELEPDVAWPHKMQQLLAKTDILFTQCGAILTGWKHGVSPDSTSSTLRVVEQLDRSIREQLNARSREPVARNTHETSTEIHDLPETKQAESPLGSVGLDGQSSAQQQSTNNNAKATIPDLYLTRILTKAEAAAIHFGREHPNPTTYICGLVRAGLMTQPQGSGQKWRFDIRDFDASAHGKLQRPTEESSAT